MTGSDPVVSVLLDSDWASGSLVDDVRRGLGSRPLRLAPKWLYDEAGSRLFDEITRLPEYYPFSAERAVLERHADDIAATSGATTLVELGSGTSEKTRLLLDAFTATGRLRRFVPVDVSEDFLREAARDLVRRYPALAVEAVVGDFTLHLGQLPGGPHATPGDRRLVAFLGGTIGNLYVEERRAFLGALADSLEPGEWVLLGTDLVKSIDRMVAAYHDSQAVTERFVTNGLHVLNRELGADFDLDAFGYVPLWDPHEERMDLRLRAETPQRVALPGADLEVDIAEGEELRVEISTKFRPERIRAELDAAGFEVAEIYTDGEETQDDFALTLARRA